MDILEQPAYLDWITELLDCRLGRRPRGRRVGEVASQLASQVLLRAGTLQPGVADDRVDQPLDLLSVIHGRYRESRASPRRSTPTAGASTERGADLSP